VSNKITRQFGFGFGSRPSKSTGDRTMLQEVEADLKKSFKVWLMSQAADDGKARKCRWQGFGAGVEGVG